MFSHVTALTWQSRKSHKDKCFLLWLVSRFIFGPRAPILLHVPHRTNKCWWIYFYCMTSFLHRSGRTRHQIFQYLGTVRARRGGCRGEQERWRNRNEESDWWSEWEPKDGGGRVKGHVHECCGSRSERNEVRQQRCVQRRSEGVEAEREAMEREGTVRGEWKTRDRKTDSAELNVSIPNGSLCNLPVPTHRYQKKKKKKKSNVCLCVCVCVYVCVCVDGRVGGDMRIWGMLRQKSERGRAEALGVIVHPAAGTGTVSEQRWSVNLPSGFSHKSH